MPRSYEQRILALLCARPEIALVLWAIAEPQAVHLHACEWSARTDSARAEGCVVTLHPADDPEGPAKIVLVVECQLQPSELRLRSLCEHLAAARSLHRAVGRVLFISPIDDVIAWAHAAFDDEPKLRPELIGREQVPRIEDLDQAIARPELAVLSAVFHGSHPGGAQIAITATRALRALREHVREEYSGLLEDALPQSLIPAVRS